VAEVVRNSVDDGELSNSKAQLSLPFLSKVGRAEVAFIK
jgi:hypothetical protein